MNYLPPINSIVICTNFDGAKIYNKHIGKLFKVIKYGVDNAIYVNPINKTDDRPAYLMMNEVEIFSFDKDIVCKKKSK